MKQTQPIDRQRGAALVVGLVFLAMLSLMGVAAYMVANQEERMAGNTRDRIRAFEAAETSLRDCEALLGGFGTLPSFGADAGMYDSSDPVLPPPAPAPVPVPETSSFDWLDVAQVRVIPQVGGAPAIPDVALQPRCVIELLGNNEIRRRSDERSGPLTVTIETIYRITAMGFGTNPSTTVNLQTMFRRQ